MAKNDDALERIRQQFPPILTTAQVAELLGLNVRTVMVMANDGRLPASRLPGSRKYHFILEDILATLARHRITSAPRGGAPRRIKERPGQAQAQAPAAKAPAAKARTAKAPAPVQARTRAAKARTAKAPAPVQARTRAAKTTAPKGSAATKGSAAAKGSAPAKTKAVRAAAAKEAPVKAPATKRSPAPRGGGASGGEGAGRRASKRPAFGRAKRTAG